MEEVSGNPNPLEENLYNYILLNYYKNIDKKKNWMLERK